MGKKTTLTKAKKAKPASKSCKKACKTKVDTAPKKSDKKKPQDRVSKAKGKAPKVKQAAIAAKSGDRPPEAKTVTARKSKKGDDKSSQAPKVATKRASREPKGNNRAAARTQSGVVSAIRAPREIGGLPKIAAGRAIFDRAPKNERRHARDDEPTVNGSTSDGESSAGSVRTYLNDEELQEFRELLLAKRQEIIRDVTNLEDEAIRQASGGTPSSSMPIHMADLGTDTWEQELTLGLIENERSLLRDIDEALERVDNKTYGMCIATSKRISKTRLQAKPWAKYCIEYARKRELGLA